MKKELLSLFILLFFLQLGHSQWAAIETGLEKDPAYAVFSISVVDEQTIWASTLNHEFNDSRFARSTDGGQTWMTGPFGSEIVENAFHIQGLSDSVAWVSTYDFNFQELEIFYNLRRTRDGGLTWEVVELPVEEPEDEIPMDFHFFNRDTGLAFTTPFDVFSFVPMHIYRTTDGGENWQKMDVDLQWKENRWFWSGNNGFEVIGDTLWIGTRGGNIVRTTDQGQTWEVFRTEFQFSEMFESGFYVGSLAFENARDGLAIIATDNNSDNKDYTFPTAVFKTSDGGVNWECINAPDRIETVEYVQGSGGVYIGTLGFSTNQYLYQPVDHVVSRDRGVSWQRVSSPNFATVQFTEPGTGWAGGDLSLGGLFRYEGPALTYDAQAAEALYFRPQGAGVLPAHHSIQDISILDENTLWAVSFFDDPDRIGVDPEDLAHQILKSEDGGQTWELVDIPFVTGIRTPEIHAVNDQVIWVSSNTSLNIFSYSGTVYKTEDGGDTWTPVFIGDAAAHWLHLFDEQHGFCMWKEDFATTSDGGATWLEGTFNFLDGEEPMFNNYVLSKFSPATLATADNTIWFGTTAGRVFKSPDRGNTWETIDPAIDPFAIINSMAFKDSLNGMYLNYLANASVPQWGGFHIGRTTDGGQTWERLPDIHPRYCFEEIIYVPGSENSYIITNHTENLAAYTTDGGDNWEIMPDFGSYGRMQFFNNTTGWVVDVNPRDSLDPIVYKWQGPDFPILSTAVPDKTVADPAAFKVLSNPFHQLIRVELAEELTHSDFELSLWNVEGRRVWRRQYGKGNGTLSEIAAADLPSGLYLLRYAGGGAVLTRRLIKH